MPYSALDVANFFVSRAIKDGHPLTPMQIGKLTFLAHGWNLGINGNPLINEPVQAWKFGPVIPSVYFAFQGFGKEPIDKQAPKFWFLKSADDSKISKDDESFLGDVYEFYSGYSGGQLSTLTHKDGSPWEETVRPWISKGEELPRFLPIEDTVIERYYRKKANAGEQQGKN